MHLSESERREIEASAERCEARTGTQVVAAVVGRCDAYPEIPWKAFALAASLAAFAATLAWPSGVAFAASPATLAPALVFLAAGAAAALATVFAAPFARLFLAAGRAETEARQYAESFFLAQELGRTQRRTAILLLVGIFERRVVILPDRGLADRLGPSELAEVIARMRPQLAGGRIAPALCEGIAALEGLLAAGGVPAAGAGDEIGGEVFEEKGA